MSLPEFSAEGDNPLDCRSLISRGSTRESRDREGEYGSTGESEQGASAPKPLPTDEEEAAGEWMALSPPCRRVAALRQPPDATVGHFMSLTLGANYARVERKFKRSYPGRRSGGSGAKRSPIRAFSRESQARLIETAHGVLGLTRALDLTYPADFPQDGKTAKRHWDALRRWLVARGVYGVAVKEFQGRGALHWHLLIGGADVTIEAVREEWSRIVGSGGSQHRAHGARMRDIDDLGRAIGYVAKNLQKQVPAFFSDVGRFWSVFGDPPRYENIVVGGSRQQLAPLIRVVRRLETKFRRERGWRTRRDNGRYGFHTRNIHEVIKKNLPRLLEFYGLQPLESPDDGNASSKK